jgi:hypothetical protein
VVLPRRGAAHHGLACSQAARARGPPDAGLRPDVGAQTAERSLRASTSAARFRTAAPRPRPAVRHVGHKWWRRQRAIAHGVSEILDSARPRFSWLATGQAEGRALRSGYPVLRIEGAPAATALKTFLRSMP